MTATLSDAALAKSIELDFRQMALMGVVRIAVEPDSAPLNISHIQNNPNMAEDEKFAKIEMLIEHAMDSGLWMVVGYIFCPECHKWEKKICAHNIPTSAINSGDSVFYEIRLQVKAQVMLAYLNASKAAPYN